jgi:radical SAM-linked protein
MPTNLHRLRITFAKGGPLQYTSHLDLARAWERSLRRGGMGLAYSGGFNPRPRLQLAAALPLGHTGEAELLDVWLEQSIRTVDFVRALVPVLPKGLTMREVRQVELKGPALQTQITSRRSIGTNPGNRSMHASRGCWRPRNWRTSGAGGGTTCGR